MLGNNLDIYFHLAQDRTFKTATKGTLHYGSHELLLDRHLCPYRHFQVYHLLCASCMEVYSVSEGLHEKRLAPRQSL